MRRAAWLCVLAIGAWACAPSGPRVPFRVITLGDDPFFGSTATAIAVTVEQHGVRDTSTTTRFAPSERALTLDPFPFGTDYALVVETELSGLVLARGRSYPFAVTPAGADRSPDVSLGVLGRFGLAAIGDASDPFLFVAPTDEGALLASAAGLTRFVAHGAHARPTLAPRTAWPGARVGGAFVALGGGVLAIGGAAPGASLVSADGTLLGELSAAELPVASGAALVALDAATVLAIGGLMPDGTRADEIRRIAWDGTTLRAARLTPLPRPRSGARAILLSARDGASLVPRVLVLDGTTATGSADDVVLVDPSDRVAPRAVTLTDPLVGAAACALDTGLVLLAGGHAAAGLASGRVTILVVQLDQTPVISALSPPPRGLFHAREGAVAVAFGVGLVLVVGGVDSMGAVAEAEIAAVSLDSLPGNVVLTGSLASAAAPAAARLSDHTVLVSTGSSVSLYFPPRGE